MTNTSSWLAYIPQHVAQDLQRHPGASPIGRERRLHVVALFADVSGFTAISEALAKSGRQATEELTTLLNSYFEPMIDLIHAYGGIIGKFGGDAMTVLFPFSPASRAATTRRAIQCAVDMQANMGRYAALRTSAGVFSLAMKAGLASGTVLCATVGDPGVRLEYLIAGAVLDRCADAEHHAGRGEVVIDHALLDAAGPLQIVERRGDFCCVAGLGRRAARARLRRPIGLPDAAVATIARYLHPSIAQRVAAGLTGFINEHRNVTVLFVRFDGFDYDHDPDVGQKLQRYLTLVIELIQRYDGYLNKVDMGDKGSKYIVVFGAPVGHEDDEARALRCALELRQLPGPSIRVGVNTGLVYCGQVGSAARQEYTVMGDTVNLAARLMQAAQPGQILLSDATRRPVSADFAWETFGPLTVKGKSEAVLIYALRELSVRSAVRLHEPAAVLPMVGRRAELKRARERLRDAAQGHGQIIAITADAGMGKSRLVAEIGRLATAHGFVGFSGACQSYGTASSYLVWHEIWRDFFDISPALAPAEQTGRLAAYLAAIDPRLVQRLPLLGLVVNSAFADTALTASLDAAMRADLLKSLLAACLRYRVSAAGELPPAPLLFVLEDCQWIDPLSLDLLEFVGRILVDMPMLLVAVYRPNESAHTTLGQLAQLAHATELRLAELTPAEAAQLIGLKLRQLFGATGEPPQELVDRIIGSAQGNPFYIEELLNLLRDRGTLPDTQTILSLELPDSLQRLVITRIDQLAESEKTTLKVASVIARLFKAHWLWGSYPQVGAPPAVLADLERLSWADLTALDRPEPELEYIFKHITTQAVAYESLAFATRAMLHEQIGHFIEQTYSQQLRQYVDVIAYHYGRSHNTEKQRRYFRWAGDLAKAAYANQVAIDYYQRLLPLLSLAEQPDVLRELGEVWQLIGKWDTAESLYRQALELAEHGQDLPAQARCCTALGHLLVFTQSYTDGVALLQRAQHQFEQLGDQSGLVRALEHLSFAYGQQGNYAAALACAERQAQIAKANQDQIGISAALENIGIIYWRQGEYERALASLDQELQLARQIGYQRGAIHASNSLAGIYTEKGDDRQALIHCQQALVIASEIGYMHGFGVLVGNMGEIYRQQGDLAQALLCYTHALIVLSQLGDWNSIYTVASNIATAYLAQGWPDEAEQLYRQVIARARMAQEPFFLCEYLYNAASLYAEQQRYAEAQPLGQEALEIATQVERNDILFPAQTLAIRLRAARGQVDSSTALAELESLLNIWTDREMQAAIHYERWRLDHAQEPSRHAAAGLYRELYAQTSKSEYGRRYTELAGQRLPEPPALPPLPELVTRTTVGLQELLERLGLMEPTHT